LILAASACEKSSFQNAPSGLMNATWVLSSIQDTKTNAQIQFPTASHSPEHIIFSDTATINVKGICNDGRGIYSISSRNNSIKIGGIGTTLVYCKFIEWEGYLWHNLDSAYSYKIAGNQLIIYSKGTYNLHFTQN